LSRNDLAVVAALTFQEENCRLCQNCANIFPLSKTSDTWPLPSHRSFASRGTAVLRRSSTLRPPRLRVRWPLRTRCPPHQPRARATRVSRSRTAGASPKAPPPRPGAAEADARSGIAERTLEHGFPPPRGTHARRVVGIHPSGEADAVCVRREPRRHVPRGMSERALV